jgi:ribonuclease P/MRP protein subunit POP1
VTERQPRMPPKLGSSKELVNTHTKKRKEPPESSSNSQRSSGNTRVKRVKTFMARNIATQKADSAFKNGELDLQSFLKSREFEIKALENGMQNQKASLNARAFQQVPRDMRRRTASHNVKRVPKRLQNRAKREMAIDNTPTVSANKRKPGSSRGRIRAETAKRLGILAAKKRAIKTKSGRDTTSGDITTRAARPKIRKNLLNDPPKPKAKFRKRQIHKTWLPTHLWHAKRAKMTEPKKPLWRFAMPVTPTEKSYRPTHRAGGTRGAVVWDMSYMSTIGLEGPIESIEKVLRALGVSEVGLWENKGEKWRSGQRSWGGWLSRELKGQRLWVCPSTIVWSAPEQDPLGDGSTEKLKKKKPSRRLFIRIHPSAFLELWTEVLRLSKLQRPVIHAEDLRFELGSIDITGPGSTEALLGILHPYQKSAEDDLKGHGKTFRSMAGVTNPSSLPLNALLAFEIMDPRLRYPPRKVALPKPTDEDANFELLQMLSIWPVDLTTPSSALFDRNARFKATRLPSQKALNRRKSLAPPGDYASILETDPRIPIMLLASRSMSSSSSSSQGTWTLLAPWKCILPIWYGLVHYPLSTGGNPRFGGLDELRQVHFEHGIPWFPADYPGTKSGYAWEADEKAKRFVEWDKRPKGKRIEWDSLDLGAGRKGEIGKGWHCDFERIIGSMPSDIDRSGEATQEMPTTLDTNPTADISLKHLTLKEFTCLLSNPRTDLPPSSTVANIRLTLISRGIATPCARIYRLPSPTPSQDSLVSSTSTSLLGPSLRDQWLDVLPVPSKSKPTPNLKKAKDLVKNRIPLNIPLPQRVRLMAEQLTQNPPRQYPAEMEEDGHPLCPGEEDLLGFVTTGEFNLAEGKGIAMGSVVVAKCLEGVRREGKGMAGRVFIVRNAGEKIGRLARWEAC